MGFGLCVDLIWRLCESHRSAADHILQLMNCKIYMRPDVGRSAHGIEHFECFFQMTERHRELAIRCS